jgi:hypothetical protein
MQVRLLGAIVVVLAAMLVVLSVQLFVIEPGIGRTLSECYVRAHSQLGGFSREQPEYYARECHLIKTCMTLRGYRFEEPTERGMLLEDAAKTMTPLERARTECRVARQRESWSKRWF